MSTGRRDTIILLLLAAVLVSVFTFPLVFNIRNYIPGFESTDESYGPLWNFWWLKYVTRHNLPERSCSMIAAPFGIDSAESGYPVWNFINKWLTVLTTNVLAYNFEILFSFMATAVFMYYLMFYLSRDRLCSAFSAVIFAFCPYHFVRAWQHLGLAQIQWLPLYILALLKLKEKADSKHIIFSVLSLFLIFSFDLYYAYFMLIVTGLFVVFTLAKGWRDKVKVRPYFRNDLNFIGKLLFCLMLVFLLISPSFYRIFKDRTKYSSQEASAHNPYIRPFEDLFSQSARPLSYFLPPVTHPVFGKFTEGFVGSGFYGESLTEHVLYLGIVPFLLSLFAFKRHRKGRKDPQIAFFFFLALAAWIFSQPPWWNVFGFKLYMPSLFLYKILPMFRAYCRFGIVVMLAVSVLAGFGLKFILDRPENRKKKVAIAILFSSLVLFEFWNYPPFKVIDVSKVPAVYHWLKKQPQDFIIAEYPLDANSPNEIYKFYQTKHEKKIINGTIPGTYANIIAKTITELSQEETAGILKWMGVKYVLVHRENYLKTGLVSDGQELNKIAGNAGLKLIRTFSDQFCGQGNIMCVRDAGPIDVYEITAFPIEPKEVRNFNGNERNPRLLSLG